MNYLQKNCKSVSNWKEFKETLSGLSKLEKGKTFEELTKYFLLAHPVYKSKLKQVWLQHELTPTLLKKLGLPKNDQGIDLIAETKEGSYWAIQCKYLQDEDKKLSHRNISTFVSLSKGIAKNISYCLVCTTLDDYATLYKGQENIGFCTSDEWRKLDKPFFDSLRTYISGKEKPLIPYQPKPHQERALQEAKNYFIDEKNKRGKLVFPCGAGKSLTGYWIYRELNAKSVLVAVPSLSLVKQTLEVYLRETNANKDDVSWLCVCSDEGIGKNDDVTVHTNEIGVPCITDKQVIADWLSKNKTKKTIIFSTYQSGKTIADACKTAKHVFDLGIIDEAHKTVGDKTKLFSHLLFDDNVLIHKRVFMTATERRYAGSSDAVLSMNDTEIYGETFSQLSFKEAIEIGILSDYKIVTLFVSNQEVKKLVDENAYVKPGGKDWDKETEARTLAALIALRKAMNHYPIHHAVTFHSSIKKAEAFEQSQDLFSKVYPELGKVQSYHVSGAMPTSVRGKVVDEFAASNKAIITNAKCLTEGVDVPNIDCVLFADPRKSTVDIVQAVGRALRKKEGKEYGYVLLPVFTNAKRTEEIIESDEFKEILTTLRALAANDERIIEYFKDSSKGKASNKKEALISFDIDEKIAAHINAKELIDTLELRTWNKLAKLSWMPFEEARAFVRSLGLKSFKSFDEYVNSENKPFDLPSSPETVYIKNGWLNWSDFLGTDNLRNINYMNFTDAREFIRSLNLKSNKEWRLYSKSGKRDRSIPGNPDSIYKNEWKGWADFLGTKNVATRNINYPSFSQAKEIAKSNNIVSQKEWLKFVNQNLQLNLPKKPENTYVNKGWINWKDFLNGRNKHKKRKTFLTYEQAKEINKKFKFNSVSEWKLHFKNKTSQYSLPVSPPNYYKENGWVNWNHFLGIDKSFLNYNEAKVFIQLNKISNHKDWGIFYTKNKPTNLPKNLQSYYKNKGWISPENFFYKREKHIDFNELRKFAKNNKIKSQNDWRLFWKINTKPNNIPYKPERAYKNKGWKGWADFLGKTNN